MQFLGLKWLLCFQLSRTWALIAFSCSTLGFGCPQFLGCAVSDCFGRSFLRWTSCCRFPHSCSVFRALTKGFFRALKVGVSPYLVKQNIQAVASIKEKQTFRDRANMQNKHKQPRAVTDKNKNVCRLLLVVIIHKDSNQMRLLTLRESIFRLKAPAVPPAACLA